MNFWPFSASGGGPQPASPADPLKRMTVGRASTAGQWLSPPEKAGKNIYGWDVYIDGKSVANMTSDDDDFVADRKLAERIAFAYNEVFTNDK